MKHKTLVILAAGIGSRFGGFKQMEPVGPSGEFIIDYSVYDAIRAGFDKVVYLISRDIENDFKATIGARTGRHVAVEYAFQDRDAVPAWFTPPPERKKPWGTGHALLACREHVNEPFAAINADDFYGAESYPALAAFLDETADDDTLHAMAGFTLKNTVTSYGHVARGLCQADEHGYLESIVERTRIECRPEGIGYVENETDWTPLTGSELVSMNFWGFKPSLFSRLDQMFEDFLRRSGTDPKAEFFIPTVVDDLMRAGAARVRVLRSAGQWIGVTYPQDKEPVMARIRALLSANAYPADLWG